MSLPIQQISGILIETAQTIVLPRFRALSAEDIETKTSNTDLVTVADKAAEVELQRRLTALMPDSIAVGEEAVSEDPTVLDGLQNDDAVWIIDPIDGTWNFAHGDEHFCLMFALALGGQVHGAWIFEPFQHRLLWAVRGEGTWMVDVRTDDRVRLHIPPPPPLSAMRGFAYGRNLDPATPLSINNKGSAGIEYIRILLGEAHFSTYDRSFPWDHAPGSLLITEAGGGYAFLDGAPYRPGGNKDHGVLSTARPEQWAAVRGALFTTPVTPE